jgi:hypothetical protein
MRLISEPQQSAHWYTSTGEAAHDSDLRRARKENLYPSVTSVLQVKSKPGLDAWKRQEAILAALTLPRRPGESDQDFAARVAIDMTETSSKAARIGTMIHNYAEQLTLGMDEPVPPQGYEAVCNMLREWIADNLDDGIAESTMVSTEYGYAGRMDWSGVFQKSGGYGILDFKTQNVKPGSKPVFYPEHCYQLAAYAEGKPMELVNVIIGVHPENPLIEVRHWKEDEIQDGWDIFRHLLRVWQIERGYRPC